MTTASRLDALVDAAPLQLSAGRLMIAASLMVAPVPAIRLLGTDTATARRVSWLTRMLAVRDGAIAVGGLVALRRGGDPGPWVLAGAVSDSVDAALFLQAVRAGRLRGPVAVLVAPAGVLAGGLGALAALRRR